MEVLPAGQKMAHLHMVGSVATYPALYMYSSLNYAGIIHLLSVNRTNGNEHSYRSLANKSFESSPDSLTVHSTRLRTLGNFPGHGSLTSIDSSRYFSDTF